MEPEKAGRRVKVKTIIAVVAAFVILSVASAAIYNGLFGWSEVSYYEEGGDYGECNVLGINLYGDLVTFAGTNDYAPEGEEYAGMTTSDDIMLAIQAEKQNDSIKAYLLEVDSYGGYPVAGEEVATALQDSGKPTVALIRQAGLSAAFWAATGADRIFASKNSDVGSIGATASYLYERQPNSQFIELNSARYKDTGTLEKPLTAEDRALILRDLNIIHQNFVEAVAKNRNLAIEKVRAAADGSSVLGERAKELGLIDEIGSWKEAEAYLETQIGEKPVVCW